MVRTTMLWCRVVIAVFASAPLSAANWMSRGPEGGQVTAIEFSAIKPNVALAGTSGGVFRSGDAGRTWRLTFPAGRPFIVKSIVFSRRSEDVYAVTNQGLYRSPDSGTTWLSPDLLAGVEPAALVIHPETSALYAATARGLQVSRNHGATWSLHLVGGKEGEVRGLAIDVSPPNTLFAVTPAGLFSSTDAKTWTPRNAAASHRGVAIGFEGTLHLWGETENLRSADGGRTWRKVAGMEKPFEWVRPGPPKTAYARAGEELMQTGDSGMTWQKIRAPDDVAVTSLTFNPMEPEEIFASTLLDGVWLTTDSGKSWKPSNQGLTATQVATITADPARPGTIYAAAGHLYRSTDRGRSWTILRRANPFAFKDVALTRDGSIFVTDVMTPIHRSTDRGATWTTVGEPKSATFIYADPANPQTLLAVAGTNGLFRSDNRGAAWTRLDSTLPFGRLSSAVKGGPVYLASSTSLRQSADGGKTWTRVVTGFGREIRINAAEVSPVQPNHLYLLTSQGVYRSDHGAQGPFNRLSTLPAVSVTAIAFHPAAPESLIVTTDGEGVFASNDRGDRWVKLKGSPSHGTAIWIDLDANKTRVLIGTPGESIWEFSP